MCNVFGDESDFFKRRMLCILVMFVEIVFMKFLLEIFCYVYVLVKIVKIKEMCLEIEINELLMRSYLK